MEHIVEIVEKGTDRVEHRIKCGALETRAEKVERGVKINLDNKHYFTRIVTEG